MDADRQDMMYKANELHCNVAEEMLYVGLSDRYTSLVSGAVSPCVPDNSRVATLDELLREYNKETAFKDELESYCNSANIYDGWILAAKGKRYYPENLYWHYQIDNGDAEHVRRAMLRNIPVERRLAVFVKDSEYMCARLGTCNLPSGNEIYIARAAYVMLDRSDWKGMIKRAKR